VETADAAGDYATAATAGGKLASLLANTGLA
jgi:hypothetical protein